MKKTRNSLVLKFLYSLSDSWEGPNCFNYSDTDHFSKEWKYKKVETNEDYEVKYKKLLASIKGQDIDVKVLIAEVESRVDNEELSDKDKLKDKCLMSYNDVITDKGGNSSSSFEADLAKAAKDSKMSNWDSSSLYHVNKFVNYSDNKKGMMFNYLCLHLSNVNQ